jgi:two-component system response regulator FixJ
VGDNASLAIELLKGNVVTNELPADFIPVHVIDDDADFRASVESTLRSVGHMVHLHASASEFCSLECAQTPCCLVVDLLMPGITGLQLCQELASSRSYCAFVMLTGHGDVSTAVEAMKLGVADFLEKPCSRERLLGAVQRASDSLRVELLEIKEEEEAQRHIEQLTAREREVFEQMNQGRVTKEIAARLGISTKTVDVHRSRISQKLRFDSPTQLGQLFAIKQRRQRRLSRNYREE